MDMEHEPRALRAQIREKSICSFKLQKEVAISQANGQGHHCSSQLTAHVTFYEFNIDLSQWSRKDLYLLLKGMKEVTFQLIFKSLKHDTNAFNDLNKVALDLEETLCGFRGDGDAAAKKLFWQPRKGLSYVLTLESDRERNAAIMVARKHALDCSVMLGGPDKV